MKKIEEDNLSKNILEQRKKYYKNMPTKGNVWKMQSENRMFSQGGIGSIQAKTIESPLKKKTNDIMDVFKELTDVTKKFQPFYETRMKEIQTENDMSQFEQDELMFEDEAFLSNYFAEMRDKIAEDLEHIDDYFPPEAGITTSKLYTTPSSV